MVYMNAVWLSVVVWMVRCSLGAIFSSAQTFKKLADFSGSNGAYLVAPSFRARMPTSTGRRRMAGPVATAWSLKSP